MWMCVSGWVAKEIILTKVFGHRHIVWKIFHCLSILERRSHRELCSHELA